MQAPIFSLTPVALATVPRAAARFSRRVSSAMIAVFQDDASKLKPKSPDQNYFTG
jgi:hypothetical protein